MLVVKLLNNSLASFLIQLGRAVTVSNKYRFIV